MTLELPVDDLTMYGSISLGIPSIDGVISADEIVDSAQSILNLQLPNGMILWFEDGHSDPWNHVEAAMALSVAGFFQEAEQAYGWLCESQLGDGSWYNYYLEDSVEDYRKDTNVCAYVATGVWHHYLITRDHTFLTQMFSCVESALDFVVSLQRDDGAITWCVEPDGSFGQYGLLTGSSSIHKSLQCGSSIARCLGKDKPEWDRAMVKLGKAIRGNPTGFEPKERWAMDWYYPVLSGALNRDQGRKLIAENWNKFVIDGVGVRCVSDQPWVTAAETAECVMALEAVGLVDQALDLFSWIQFMRAPDGAYWTGWVIPDKVHFPGGETTSYTSAAVILAAAALSSIDESSGIFRV